MKRTMLCLILATSSAMAKPEPLLSLTTDIEAWTSPHSPDTRTAEVISSLGISNLSMNIYVDKGSILTVACIVTTHPDVRHVWLDQTNNVAFEAVSADTYRWLPPKPPRGTPDILNQDTLLVRFSGSTVLIAATNHFELAEQLMAETDTGLLRSTINIAPMIDPFFTAVRNILDEQEEGFFKAILSGAVDGMAKAAESIKEFPLISLTINPTAERRREMDLALEFRNPVSASLALAFFADPENAWKNPAITDAQLSIIELAASPDFKGVDLENQNTLHLKYEWPAERDMEMLKTIASPLTDNLLSLAGGREEYPIENKEVIADPALKSLPGFQPGKIEQRIRNATFFARQTPRDVQFVIDYLDIPNTDLIKTSITNAVLQATNGANVVIDEHPTQFSINSQEQTGHVYLKKDQEKPDAVIAAFTLMYEVPVEIETITLTPENPVYEDGDRGCCIVEISNSVVRIRSRNLSLREAAIYGRNSEGEYLRRPSARWSASKFTATYKGLPAAVEIVLPIHYETVSIDFKDVSVSKGSEIKMPDTPTNNIPVRYTAKSVKTFSDPDMAVFAQGLMTVETNAGFRDSQCILRFPKLPNVKTRSLSLRSYLVGTDAFVFKGQKSGYSSNQGAFTWSTDQNTLPPEATAVFGEVTAAFWTGTGSYTIDVSTNPVPLIAGREEPTAFAEHNVIWIKEGRDEKILDVQAYDPSGKRLKRDYRISYRNKARGYHFWGFPVRTTIAYSTGAVTSTVPFEVELKSGGLAEVAKVRTKAEAFEKFLEEVMQIDKDSRRISDLLAGNYYVLNNDNEPTAWIPLEIAQSDPTGASIFGYEVKPYKGYHFQRITWAGMSNRNISSIAWAGGAFEAGGTGYLLATPVEVGKPAILMLWGNIHINYNDCSQLKEIDTKSKNMKETGWLQIW